MVFITTQSITAEITRQQRLAADIAGEQTKISTTKKINQPSDNPHDWVQISQVGRRQSINAAWKGNLTFAESRATQASTNLNEVNNLMTRVTELIVTSTSTADGSTGREAVAKELEGIRATINDLLNQTDYQGTPVFDHPSAVLIPLGAGLNVEAVPTRASIMENAVGSRSIDQVISDIINVVRTGTEADRSAALQDARTALDHVIVAQSVQGVRSQRLEDIGGRLTNSDLALSERRSALEDTDITETSVKLQSKLLTLEAAQLAFARINQKSLFDLF